MVSIWGERAEKKEVRGELVWFELAGKQINCSHFKREGGNEGGGLEPVTLLKGKKLSQSLKTWQGNAQEEI